MPTAAHRLVTGRPWLTATVAVVVAGVAVGVYLLTKDGGASTNAADAASSTHLVTVTSGTLRESVSTTGTFSPADQKSLSFGASGQVTSVRVGVGDKVRKGQVLGTIDPVSLKASLAQAEATLADAQSQLGTAEDGGAASSAQIAADQASVTTAQSSVRSAKAALADAVLRSPIAGTVATVNVVKGDRAGSGQSSGTSNGSAGSGQGQATTGGSAGGTGTTQGTSGSSSTSSSSGSADFVVIGGKSWTVSAAVDDTQVGLISKGDQAQITTDNAGRPLFGTVSSVGVLSSSSSGSASYPVTVSITGTPTGLHDGASATVSIVYRQLVNALTVPSAALHTTTSGSYVYLDHGGSKVKRTVTTGVSSNGSVQIKSGLSAGDQVYVEVTASRGGAVPGNGTASGSSARSRFGGGTGRYGGGFGGGTGGFGGAVPSGGR